MKTENEHVQRARNVFATNFRDCLLRAGRTQSDVASALEVTSSTVSDWANAKKYPRVDKMQALADYLGVRMSDLREEKPIASRDDELWEKITEDEAKLTLVRWIAGLDRNGFDRIKRLLDAAEMLPKE